MKGVKLKIVLLSLTILLLCATCGVAVYAYLTQSFNGNTQIIISDSGQAKSVIKISDFIGPNDNSNYIDLTVEPDFIEVLAKTRDEDIKEGEFLRDVEFSFTNYYRYYLIKIEIQNLSEVDATYQISCLDDQGNPFVFSSQVEINYLKNEGEQFNLVSTSSTGKLTPDEQACVYIAISVVDGQDLWGLSNIQKQNFNLRVEVKV